MVIGQNCDASAQPVFCQSNWQVTRSTKLSMRDLLTGEVRIKPESTTLEITGG